MVKSDDQRNVNATDWSWTLMLLMFKGFQTPLYLFPTRLFNNIVTIIVRFVQSFCCKKSKLMLEYIPLLKG